MRLATSRLPSVSRLVVGSSSSHNTAPVSSTPASATRRRCPADSVRTGAIRERLRAGAFQRRVYFTGRDGAADADRIAQIFPAGEISLEWGFVSEIGELGVEFVT